MLQDLFATGRIVDLILLLVVAETGALWLFHRLTGRGPSPRDLFPTLLSGAFLLAALRVALTGGWWGWVAASLTLALVAHVADLLRRRS